jgi:hypothetical protein
LRRESHWKIEPAASATVSSAFSMGSCSTFNVTSFAGSTRTVSVNNFVRDASDHFR